MAYSVPISSAARQAAFLRDGFLVLPGFVSRAACRELMARAEALVAAFDPGPLRPLFSTTEQTRTADAYFLGSGDQIRYFFEPECVAPDGSLLRPKHLALNKIGHALHDLDPVFARFSHTPALGALAGELGMRAPLLLQSMYLFKAPHVGGEVVCHQDATFLYTEPISVLGLWFALQDADRNNGCLWALPGGHRLGLRRRFVRQRGGGTAFIVYDPRPFPAAEMVPLEVEQGSLVVLHGLLPHRSDRNRGGRSRHAYSLHFIAADAAYPADNWLQRAGETGRSGGHVPVPPQPAQPVELPHRLRRWEVPPPPRRALPARIYRLPNGS